MLKKYLHSVGVLGATEVLLRLKGLILVPILAKCFGTVNYGIWAQVSVITSMLLPLALLGTDSAAVRFLPGLPADRQHRGLFTLASYYLLVSLVVIALLWGIARPVAVTCFGGGEHARFVVLCGGVVAAGLLTGLCRNYFRVIGRTGAFAALNLLQALYSAGIAAGVAAAHGSIATIITLELACDLLLATGVLLYIGVRHGFAAPDWSLLGKFVRFGLPLVPVGYAVWALNLADRVILSKYCGMADVGVYSCVYSLGYLAIGLCFNPVWLMYPTLAADLYNRGQKAELGNLFRQSTRLALGMLTPAIVGLGLVADPLLRLFATTEFAAGAPVMPVVALGYLFFMMAAYFDTALALAGKQGWSTVAVTVAAVVNIGLNLLWIPRFGIAGAALATLAGFALQLGVVILPGRTCMEFPFDWLFLGKVCAATGGMAGVLWFFPKTPAPLWLVANILCGIVVYGVFMLCFKAVSQREWIAIVQMVRGRTADVNNRPTAVP